MPVPVSRNNYYDRPWIYVYNARSGALVSDFITAATYADGRWHRVPLRPPDPHRRLVGLRR